MAVVVVVVIHQQAKEHLRIKTPRNVIQVRTIRMLINVNNHQPVLVVLVVTKRKGADQEMIINPMTNVVLLVVVTAVPVASLFQLLLAMVVVDNRKIEVNRIHLRRVLNKEEIRQDFKHDLPGNKKKYYPRATKTTIIITTTYDDDDDDKKMLTDNLIKWCIMCFVESNVESWEKV
jgi:hypothetical protein